jgi:probable HAF family extracellular repeat protein
VVLAGSAALPGTAPEARADAGSTVGVSGDATDQPTQGRLPRYQLVDLGTLGGAASGAVAASDRGSAVGWAETESGAVHAFFWADGQMTDLGTLGGVWSEARSVNSARQVVGVSLDGAGQLRAFYRFEGEMLDLNNLMENPASTDGAEGATFLPLPMLTEANSINNNGQIVAAGLVGYEDSTHAFLLSPREPYDPHSPRFDFLDLGWFTEANSPIDALFAHWGERDSLFDLDGNGTVGMSDLLILLAQMGGDEAASEGGAGIPTIPVEPVLMATDVNGFGRVVGTYLGSFGQQAFLWQDDQYEALPAPSLYSGANAVNELGAVAGWVVQPDGSQVASVWTGDARADLHAAPGWSSYATDVNDRGDVVGSAADAGMVASAYLWAGGEAVDLNQVTAIPLMPGTSDLRLEVATAIDEHGRIVGSGRMPDGHSRAFRLEPLR